MIPIRNPRRRRVAVLLAIATIAFGLGVLRLGPGARPARPVDTEAVSTSPPAEQRGDPRESPGQAEPRTLPGADASASAPPNAPAGGVRRDLETDEAAGGHTLARHVALSDAQLRDRLRREPRIRAASTWTDRATAERAVGITLVREASRISAWSDRQGSRPNLALDYRGDPRAPVGRSLLRGAREAVPAEDAVVVLRWDARADRYYVLTAYPEAR